MFVSHAYKRLSVHRSGLGSKKKATSIESSKNTFYVQTYNALKSSSKKKIMSKTEGFFFRWLILWMKQHIAKSYSYFFLVAPENYCKPHYAIQINCVLCVLISAIQLPLLCCVFVFVTRLPLNRFSTSNK